jgi:hypothetical protein
MKRGLIAFAIGSLVFAAVYASAASLTVTSGVLQSGGGDTGTCDADGVAATYTLVWNNATSDYDIDKVTVTGINSACATLPIEVDLANAAGASLSHVATTVQAGGGSQLIDVPNASATNTAKTQVAIHS